MSKAAAALSILSRDYHYGVHSHDQDSTLAPWT